MPFTALRIQQHIQRREGEIHVLSDRFSNQKEGYFFFILFVGYTHNTKTLTCSVQQGAGDCTRLLRPSDFIQILQTQVPQPVNNNNPCVIFERFRF